MKNVFKELSSVNVNEFTEDKSGLTYLSWTHAWGEVKKRYSDATYQIWKDEKGNPYTFNDTLGYMCYTTVCIEGETLEMWLPVMNGANKAMLNKPYTYKTKYAEKTVEPATMFDINKTIMRCLVKNLAMFGLGLYIYSGEDLPTQPKEKLTDDKFKKALDFDKKQIQSVINKFDLEPEQLEQLKAKL
jgi:hypothetical protein